MTYITNMQLIPYNTHHNETIHTGSKIQAGNGVFYVHPKFHNYRISLNKRAGRVGRKRPLSLLDFNESRSVDTRRAELCVLTI